MTEYLSKKAVLEWILHNKTWRSWDDYCEVQEAIQFGAFDADDSEIQRLRAALLSIEEEMADDTSPRAQRINRIIQESLSTTTEPTAQRARDKMKSLFEAWDLRGICKDSLEGYEQGVMLELIGLCEEIAGINATEKVENNA